MTDPSFFGATLDEPEATDTETTPLDAIKAAIAAGSPEAALEKLKELGFELASVTVEIEPPDDEDRPNFHARAADSARKAMEKVNA